MKTSFKDIGGHVSKENENYTTHDNVIGDYLVLSKTILYPGKHTAGHKHTQQDEIFIITQGTGEIHMRYPDEDQGEMDELYSVKQNDIVSVQAGVFHRVFNTGEDELNYIRVMNRPTTI